MREDEGSLMRIFEPGEFPALVGVAKEKVSTGEDAHYPNYHSEFEFHLIRQGGGQYFIRDTNYPVARNSVFIMHKDEVHCYIPDPLSSAKNMTLIFAPQMLKNKPIAKAALRSLESMHLLTLSDKQAVRAELLLSEIADECKEDALHRQEVVADLIEIFLIILQRFAEGSCHDSKTPDPLIQEVIKYLDEVFAEKPSLIEVSNRFCLSSFTLSKKFKQYVGLGFREYLIHRCIVEAQRLLAETDLKVASIAYQVGFESLSSFNSNFLRLTGVTPVVYKKNSFAGRASDL